MDRDDFCFSAEKYRKLEQLTDSVPTQIWEMTDERTYGYANAAHAAFLGKTPAEIEHMDIYDLLPEAVADLCVAHNRSAVSAKAPSISEEWALSAGGEKKLLQITKTPKFDESGGLLFISCTAEDVTARHQLMEQNLLKERILNAIVRFSRELFSDEPDAIARGLATLGEAAAVDRVYYWENHYDEAKKTWLTSQKFEWCGEKAAAQIDNENLQNVPLEAFEDFMGPLRRNRPFIAHVKDLPNASTREILTAQQIQSILVLPVQQKGVFSGFVGFDSCAYERRWTANEITLLEAFVELLSKSIQRNLLQREIAQNRRNFEYFFNTMDDLLFILDPRGRILHINHTVTLKLGYSETELLGKSAWILHAPERRKEARKVVSDILAGACQVSRVPIQAKDGTQFPVETHVFHGEWDGKPALFGVSQDTTLLEFSAEKFSKAFDNSSLLMGIVNVEDAAHIDANAALCRTLGYTHEEIIGKTPFELHLLASPADGEVILQALRNKKPIENAEIAILDKDKNRHFVIINATPIRIGVLSCVVVTMLDITERKRMESELKDYSEHLEELVQEKVAQLSTALWGTITALVRLAESRDGSTGEHLKRLAESCGIVARQLAKSAPFQSVLQPGYIENLQKASTLHDIGKVGIRDGILLKQGKLTPGEYEEMKAHTSIGAQTLMEAYQHYQGSEIIRMAIDIAASHHERWDGNGYPAGLRKDEIPLPAQIVSICDVYDALRSKRSYKPGYTHRQSVRQIQSECGTHFNPKICEAFLAVTDQIEDLYRGYSP